MPHLGERIKNIRGMLNLSQQDLAEKSGISKTQISRIESGEQNNPQIRTVISISTALNLTIEELIFGDESTTNSYLTQAINRLPNEDQKMIKKLIKMWVLTAESEKLDKE
ncbi:helix-turn-helix domain-containing protein [Arsenophonus sp. PmNCSU2021_1]|uniref:helix-turn-helix domain-containing protein n=1 Tax=Arsenophonus sp. PmNCSU2021_1 TaxID=3118989 RepID=UPI002FF056EF